MGGRGSKSAQAGGQIGVDRSVTGANPPAGSTIGVDAGVTNVRPANPNSVENLRRLNAEVDRENAAAERAYQADRSVTERRRRQIPKSSVYFEDSSYRFTHGHAPRGTGIWVFRAGDSETYTTPEAVPFSKAKSQAREWAATNGHYTVNIDG